MKEYKIGFSLKGLAAFLIIMLPNIFWMIVPPANEFLSTNSSSVALINIIMTVSQWIMIALLILLIRKSPEAIKKKNNSGDKYAFVWNFCFIIIQQKK